MRFVDAAADSARLCMIIAKSTKNESDMRSTAKITRSDDGARSRSCEENKDILFIEDYERTRLSGSSNMNLFFGNPYCYASFGTWKRSPTICRDRDLGRNTS